MNTEKCGSIVDIQFETLKRERKTDRQKETGKRKN